MKIPERCSDIGAVINSGPLEISEDVIGFAREYNGRYLHWNDLKYREFGNPAGWTQAVVCVRSNRVKTLMNIHMVPKIHDRWS